MFKIYLAGPFFNEKQIDVIERIENEFDKYGFDYFSPRKGGGVISHLSPEERTKASKRIYETNEASVDLRRYTVTYTDENFGLNIMLKESVDAHIVGDSDLKSFCGICAGNWDAPVGKEKNPEWSDNSSRRKKILGQFQNFNPDVI